MNIIKSLVVSSTVLASMLASNSSANAITTSVVQKDIDVSQDGPKNANNSISNSGNMDAEVKISGYLNAEYGVVNQKDDFKIASSVTDIEHIKNLGWAQQQGIATDAKLKFSVEKNFGINSKYGAVLKILANPSPTSGGNKNVAASGYIYLQSDFGSIEIGSNDSASNTLKFSAYKIAYATGGIDGDWSNWVNNAAFFNDDKQNNLGKLFIIGPFLPYSSDNKKESNKITYYSPEINNFVFGISYVPNTAFIGTTYSAGILHDRAYNNLIEAALKYQKSFKNNLDIGLSLSGEFAPPKALVIKDTSKVHRKYDRTGIKAWEVGGQLGYKQLTFAASYGDFGDSNTLKDRKLLFGGAKLGKFWTAGVAYAKDKLGVSLTYLGSKRAGGIVNVGDEFLGYDIPVVGNDAGNVNINKFSCLSLGAQYQLLPGLAPYAEFTSFKYDSKIPNVKNNSGNVLIVGAEVSF